MEILAPVHLFEGCEAPLPPALAPGHNMHDHFGSSSSETPWGHTEDPGSHPAPRRTSTSPCLEVIFLSLKEKLQI